MGRVRRRRPAREEQAGAGELGRLGQILGKDLKWKLIFEFQINLDFGKTLRISTRRFRRNLDMRISTKFF
jgi:hypothetical protein